MKDFDWQGKRKSEQPIWGFIAPFLEFISLLFSPLFRSFLQPGNLEVRLGHVKRDALVTYWLPGRDG
jgi:hypothetical protein